MMKRRSRPALRALAFAAPAAAWTVASSLFLGELLADADAARRVGLAFLWVVFTSGLLYWLVRGFARGHGAGSDREALASARLLRNSPLAMIEFDAELRLLGWSGRAEEIFGWREAEVLGRTLTEISLVFPEDEESVLAMLRRLGDGDEPRQFNRNRNLTKDGKLVYCEWYNSVQRGPAGEVRSFLSLAVDVTERHEARRALEASEARYRSMFENSHAVMLLLEPDTGAICDANPAAAKFYGWPREQLVKLRIEQINVLDPESIQAEMRAAKEARRNFFVFQHRRADGSLVDVEVYSGRVRVDDRDLLLSIVHDVTDRRGAERALQTSEARFRALVEGAPDMIFVQADGRFAFVNRAGCRLLGAADAAQLIGQPVIDRVHPDFRERVQSRMRALLDRREAQPPMEQLWLRLDGTPVDIEVSGVPVRFNGQAGALGFARDITDRKVVAQRLDENARLLAMATTAAQIGGWSVDLLQQTQHWSDEVCRIHDVPPGRKMPLEEGIEFYAPEWRPLIRKAFSRCAEEGVPYDEEMEIITARGRRVWVRTIGQPVRDQTGRIVKVQGAFQDISARKRAETRLALGARRAELMLELSRLIEELDEDAFLDHGLEKMVELTGSRHGCLHLVEEGPGAPPKARCKSSNAPAAGPEFPLEEALRTGTTAVSGSPAAATDGGGEVAASPCPERLVSVPVKDGGRVAMLVSMARVDRDFNQFDLETMELFGSRLWALVSARRSQLRIRQLSQAIEQSPESIAITDLEPRIEYVNAAFCRASGYSREELIGQNPRVLQSGRTPKAHYEAMWAQLTSGESWAGEFYNRRKDGSEYVELGHVAPLRGPDGVVTHYIAVKEDITEKKEIARELDRHRHHLEEMVAQRTAELAEARLLAEAANEAKSAFLANMSHEIRTPMNGVLGMIEVLSATPLDSRQRDMIEVIRESGKAVAGVIEDILDFSKIEAGRLELEQSQVSVRRLVEGLCDSLVPLAASQNVQLSLFVSPEVPERALMDEVRVRQVLYNLVGNGIKFSRGRPEQRGIVSVRVERRGSNPTRVVFTVKDNGIGMAPETVGRLFSPFSQAEASTTRRFGGSGLGLSICRRIVDLMGGQISVSSELGKGATFTVALPVEVPQQQPVVQLPDLAGLVCLLVDSKDYDMDGLAIYLRHAGGQVRREATAAAARAFEPPGDQRPVIVEYVGADHVASWAPGGDPSRGYVHITRGRPAVMEVDGNRVLIDETSQRRATLLNAVAVAGGRMAAPAASPDPAATDRRKPAEHGAAGQILVAEDDEINRQVITKQLELLGYSADVARHGLEALQMWRKGSYRLVLTDLHMPEMDGYTLTRSIRNEESMARGGRSPEARVPIVALTANALRGEEERAKSVGLDDYLTKPLQLARLQACLERWLPAVSSTGAQAASPVAAVPVLDLDVLRQLVGGDDGAVYGLLREYVDTADGELQKLVSGIEGGDARAVAFVAHKLKSSSRSVGAVSLGALFEQMEMAGKASDLSALESLGAQLDSHWAAVRNAALQALEEADH